MISALLLASVAAAPALAQDRQHGDHRGGGDRQEAGHPEGGNRAEGGEHGGGRQHQGGAPQARPQEAPRPQPSMGGRPDAARAGWRDNGGGYRGDDHRGDAGRHVEGRSDNGVNVWRNNDRGEAHFDRDRGQPGWNGDRGRPGGWNGGHDRAGWDHGRPGGWNGDRGHSGNWNRSWRNDRRYDWQGWRNSHRSYYHVGRYRAPHGYGWGYRRFGVGVRIDPVFFARDYWIDNPDYYRLPPAYGQYRWVRYYNDALLVDVYSGYIVDEIPDFFW
jgi:hypothetical protein